MEGRVCRPVLQIKTLPSDDDVSVTLLQVLIEGSHGGIGKQVHWWGEHLARLQEREQIGQILTTITPVGLSPSLMLDLPVALKGVEHSSPMRHFCGHNSDVNAWRRHLLFARS